MTIKKKKTPKKGEKKLNLPKISSNQTQEKTLKQKFTTGYYHCLADS
jgi:hypothetical protein